MKNLIILTYRLWLQDPIVKLSYNDKQVTVRHGKLDKGSSNKPLCVYGCAAGEKSCYGLTSFIIKYINKVDIIINPKFFINNEFISFEETISSDKNIIIKNFHYFGNINKLSRENFLSCKKYENEENASELEIEDQVNKLILINSDNKEKEIL
ncbi:hypothetical protein H8356DRAFT_1322571 [Neocallimastix lanati (nom. inval.)]|nr:hypothetical protein H8356DRAFT_1322571 [Neocallimastix sp. JGI-2020a]